jgi:hypothetical protein
VRRRVLRNGEPAVDGHERHVVVSRGVPAEWDGGFLTPGILKCESAQSLKSAIAQPAATRGVVERMHVEPSTTRTGAIRKAGSVGRVPRGAIVESGFEAVSGWSCGCG